MKSLPALILAITLAITLAACGVNTAPAEPSTASAAGAGTSQSAPADQLLNPESGSTSSSAPNTSTLETMSEPPALTVFTLYDADQVRAPRFGYQWTTPQPNGEAMSFIACGSTPLQAEDHLENAILYTAFRGSDLPPLEEGQLPGCIVPIYTLKFDGPAPESVTARRWKAEDLGKDDLTDVWEEPVSAALENGVWQLAPMGDGEFVYEVTADWGEMGNAIYGFRTIPELRPCSPPLVQ